LPGRGGGTEEKPVGLVFIALADDEGVQSIRLAFFSGDRHFVRTLSVDACAAICSRRRII
jgi:nicotinamide mononucleotide (NMN) deamidase PncC